MLQLAVIVVMLFLKYSLNSISIFSIISQSFAFQLKFNNVNKHCLTINSSSEDSKREFELDDDCSILVIQLLMITSQPFSTAVLLTPKMLVHYQTSKLCAYIKVLFFFVLFPFLALAHNIGNFSFYVYFLTPKKHVQTANPLLCHFFPFWIKNRGRIGR